MSSERANELLSLRQSVVDDLSCAHEARERGLTLSRQVIRHSSRSIRMVHRAEMVQAQQEADQAEAVLREAQNALEPHPRVKYAGFLHDAEKEYVEARITAALVGGEPLQSYRDMNVESAAWLNGLCEAASEMRRYVLDQLRSDNFEKTDVVLNSMDEVYELLVSIDFPDALTGGLRRSTDAYRAVLERTRSDYATAVMQASLRMALSRAL